MLEMSSALAISGSNRPTITFHYNLAISLSNHGLYRNAHSFFNKAPVPLFP